jgi:hypothetical protein
LYGGRTICASVAPHLYIGMTIQAKPAFKKPTISLAASGVNCKRLLGRGSEQKGFTSETLGVDAEQPYNLTFADRIPL